jgi:hypothetical protein
MAMWVCLVDSHINKLPGNHNHNTPPSSTFLNDINSHQSAPVITMSDSTHTLENPLPAIDEMSLEEDPPAEEIGLALERFRDGSVGNRTVVTSAHSMEEGREAAELVS